MRHCVTCDADYENDPTRCPSCGSVTLTDHEVLLWREQRTALAEEHFAPVKVLEGPADEAFVREMLEESGFDFQIVVHPDDAFAPLLASSRGYGVVLVPESDVDPVRRLLHDLMTAAPLPDDTVL